MMVAGGVGMVWVSVRKEENHKTGEGRMITSALGTAIIQNTTQPWPHARTQDWLAQHKDKDHPSCLHVGLVAPHFPLVVPQVFYDLYPLGSLHEVKLHTTARHIRHPWIEEQNAFMVSEAKLTSAQKLLMAMASYHGLYSWLDHNVGQVIAALADTGLTETTTVIDSSDNGDNVGARGLSGKFNMYEKKRR